MPDPISFRRLLLGFLLPVSLGVVPPAAASQIAGDCGEIHETASLPQSYFDFQARYRTGDAISFLSGRPPSVASGTFVKLVWENGQSWLHYRPFGTDRDARLPIDEIDFEMMRPGKSVPELHRFRASDVVKLTRKDGGKKLEGVVLGYSPEGLIHFRPRGGSPTYHEPSEFDFAKYPPTRVGKVYSLPELRLELAGLFRDGDEHFWHSYYKRQPGTRLPGGSKGGAYRYQDPGGKPVILKRFHHDELDPMAPREPEDFARIVREMKAWEKEGRGVRVVGVGIERSTKAPSTKELHPEVEYVLAMEDYFSAKNVLGTKVLGGDGNNAKLLAAYPAAVRRWAMKKMLSLLDSHGDPHLGNLLFRVTKLAPNVKLPTHDHYLRMGDEILEMVTIDGTGTPFPENSPVRHGPVEEVPEVFRQYNRAEQQRTLERALGLAG